MASCDIKVSLLLLSRSRVVLQGNAGRFMGSEGRSGLLPRPPRDAQDFVSFACEASFSFLVQSCQGLSPSLGSALSSSPREDLGPATPGLSAPPRVEASQPGAMTGLGEGWRQLPRGHVARPELGQQRCPRSWPAASQEEPSVDVEAPARAPISPQPCLWPLLAPRPHPGWRS